MAETGESTLDSENFELADFFSFPKVVNALVSRLRFSTFSLEADLGVLFLLDFDSLLFDLTDLIVN